MNTRSKKVNDITKAIVEKSTTDKALKQTTIIKNTVPEVFNTILSLLKESGTDKIVIKGFGRFEKKTIPTRVYRNPRTGGTVKKEPKEVLRFKFSKKAF